MTPPTAWRMYRRTLDNLETIEYWRNQGTATELAAHTTWIRNQARLEGLTPHPTAMATWYTVDDGEEPIGLCVSIPVAADPDPRFVAPLEPVRAMRDRETQDELRDARRSAGFLGCSWILVILAIGAVLALLVAAPRRAPDAPPSQALPGAPSVAPSAGEGPPALAGDPVLAGVRLAGTATFYCATKAEYPPDGSDCTAGYDPGDLVAAIDADLGIGKGELVEVRFGRRAPVTVRIVDVCGCPGERLIDLTAEAFARVYVGSARMTAKQRRAALAAGVLHVTLEVTGASSTLPPTDSATNIPKIIPGVER